MLVVTACSGGDDDAAGSAPVPTATVAQQPAASSPGATTDGARTVQPAARSAPSAPLARNFTLPSGDGKSVSLESYRNSKNVVVVFHRGFW
jgi:hypothetical protein